MLLRFVVDKVFSFGEQKEFNMFPRPKYRTLDNHKYAINDFEVLKLSAVYGANGAGKSNLVKALSLLQDIVIDETPHNLKRSQFKFQKNENFFPQIFAIEFLQDNKAFYYALEITDNIISTEELYLSGLGKKNDKLLYERKTSKKEITTINFFDGFDTEKENEILKGVIEKNLSKPNKPILKLLTTLNNPLFEIINTAFLWFDDTLQIILPESKPAALAHLIYINDEFKRFAENIMCSYNIGIKGLISKKKSIRDFFGEDNLNDLNKIVEKLEETNKNLLSFHNRNGDEIVLAKEGNQYNIHQLELEHIGKDGVTATFRLDEESDGTIRLLDFIPAFRSVVSEPKIFFIDEIERSIHPLLIKELITKFSQDNETKGQLIFTTHESNLLDQSIFRQDEIWFVEKDKNGCTDIYSLSDFKEHNTIDIRKGYLNGRYGSIPFLANLQDLNWHNHVIEE